MRIQLVLPLLIAVVAGIYIFPARVFGQELINDLQALESLDADEQPAPQLVMIQPLDFGKFAIASGDGPRTITVSPDGIVTTDDRIVTDNANAAQRGEYELTGFPPHMKFYTGVRESQPPSRGGIVIEKQEDLTQNSGEGFFLGDFTTNEPETDAEGNATLYVGATLKAPDDTDRREKGAYTGSFNILIYY